MKIKIITEATGEIIGLLTDENPVTSNAIWDTLPIEARVNTWGDEIYFSIPVNIDEENPKEIVELGDLGYWPPGNAFCIFFGKTPASRGNEIRPASPVNVFGRVESNPTAFKKVRSGEKIRIEKVGNQ
jgi:hypothetical protein